MTATAPQQVLDRFMEADALLRQAQEQLAGLAAARVSAEASADQLAHAAAAVADFVASARSATEEAARVQEQVAGALQDLRKLSTSFNSVKVLESLEEVRVQVGDLREATESQARRLAEVERLSEALPKNLDALSRRFARQMTTQRTEIAEALEQSHNEIVSSAEEVLERDARMTARLDAIAADIAALGSRKAQEVEAITGIVDVLPRRSRRKLGR